MQLNIRPGYGYEFTYTNYAGETAVRHVMVKALEYGTAGAWHPTPTWLLRCWDFDKGAERSFDLTKIDGASIEPLDMTSYVAHRTGQAIEQAHPFGYRSEDKEP